MKIPARLKRDAAKVLMAAMMVLFTATTVVSQSTPYRLPITLEYQMLRHLVVQAAFTEADDSATVLDEEDGCAKIVISDPQFSQSDNLLRSLIHVSLKLGKAFGNDCFLPIQWEGYLELLQQPRFAPDDFTLKFETVDSNLYTNDKKPARVSPFIWNRIRTDVSRHMEKITLDLAPPVDDLKTFLLPLFPPRNQQIAKEALATLEPGEITVSPNHIEAGINIYLPEKPVISDDTPPETRLTMEEQARFIETWEQWDAFLVHIITQLAGKKLSLEDRQTLLETLLITRHRFSQALESANQHRDFVRSQFVDAWQQLAPVFRKALLRPNAKNPFGYLSFFTASDALIALDAVSPDLGLDISNNGLVRLAKILDDTPLQYTLEVDTTLRQIVGLPPEPPDSIEMPENQFQESIEPQGRKSGQSTIQPLSWLKTLLSPVAWATANSDDKKSFAFDQWLLHRENRDVYLRNILMLLQRAATATHVQKKIAIDLYQFYIPFIQATAWLESCFRQFHIRDGTPTYLRSYSGTSVGLMQVNERAWRGIYDMERLRWDITYNALAGTQIAARYVKYVQKKIDNIDNIDTLDDKAIAGLVFAIYHAGPGLFKKVWARHQNGEYLLADHLFQEKWDWVLSRQWDQIDQCLGKIKNEPANDY